MDPHLQALADAVFAVRGELRMSQQEFARHADLSIDTIQDIEGGKRRTFRPKTKSKLEQAVPWWPAGTFDHILREGVVPELASIRSHLSPREQIVAMSMDEVLRISELIEYATGSGEMAYRWIQAAKEVQRSDNGDVKSSGQRGA